jgi:hypothetical protein
MTMIHDVVAAEYRGDYRIEVCFDDGSRGVVDFTKYLDKGGVFTRFRDLEFFKRFDINRELGVLSWENGMVDVAPDVLYAEATGTPLPRWMETEETSIPIQTP